MTWHAWKLTYRAMSPILIGDQLFGSIQRTRLYIPSWTLWGAITARLTRAWFSSATANEYDQIGKFVANNILTSYAGIRIGENDEGALPNFNGKWKMGIISQPEFERAYLSSIGHTAVAPGTMTSEPGALHETEALMPFDHSGKPVFWQFSLYIRQPWDSSGQDLLQKTMADVMTVVENLVVGAERGYGFGHLKIVPRRDIHNPVKILNQDWPEPNDWRDSILRAHVPVDDLKGIVVEGKTEWITRRLHQMDLDTGAWGPGQKIETREYYCPGCRIKNGEWRPTVGPYGLWRKEGFDAQSNPS